MLIETLSSLIPNKGALHVTIAHDGDGIRLAIIPTPKDVKEDTSDGELRARQAALISPIILRFDPKIEGIDQAVANEIRDYAPHVAGAADRLETYVSDQERLKSEADAARAEKAKASSKTKTKGKAADKAKGKVASKGADEAADDKSGAPDLFSASVPAPESSDAATTKTGAAVEGGADESATADAASQDAGEAS